MGRKIVIVGLGGALLVALVVTMIRISGPATGSMGQRALVKREASLRTKTIQILQEANARFSQAGLSVVASSTIRFDGEVLRILVGPGWKKLPRDKRANVVEFVVSQYVPFWQREMKSHREPAIVFREGALQVGLYTKVDHWVR